MQPEAVGKAGVPLIDRTLYLSRYSGHYRRNPRLDLPPLMDVRTPSPSH